MKAIKVAVMVLALPLFAAVFGAIGAIVSGLLGGGGAYVGTWVANAFVAKGAGVVLGGLEGAVAGFIGAIVATAGLMTAILMLSVFTGGGATEVFDRWGNPIGYISSGGGDLGASFGFSLYGGIAALPAAVIAGAIAGAQLNRGITIEPSRAAQWGAFICLCIGGISGVIAGLLEGWRDKGGVGSCTCVGIALGVIATRHTDWKGILTGAFVGGLLGYLVGGVVNRPDAW